MIKTRIGIGNTAEVFEHGDDKVLKLYYESQPASSIYQEFNKTQAFNQSGIPCPKAFEVVRHNNRLGIVFEKVQGKSLLNVLINSGDVEYTSNILASLHQAILSKTSTILPSYKTFLFQYVNGNDTETLALIDKLDDDNTLCHGDFHPGNIIMNHEQAVVIDFMNACSGPRLYDIARTYYLIRYSPVPPYIKDQDAIKKLQVILSDQYLHKMGVRREILEDYLTVIAKTRDSEMKK